MCQIGKHCSWESSDFTLTDWIEERLEYYERAAWQPASSLNVEQLAGNVAMGSQIYLLLPSNRNRVHAQGVKAGHFYADGNISRRLQINVPVCIGKHKKQRLANIGWIKILETEREKKGRGRWQRIERSVFLQYFNWITRLRMRMRKTGGMRYRAPHGANKDILWE